MTFFFWTHILLVASLVETQFFFNTRCQFGIAEHSKSIDMWRRAGRGGTHVAILVAVGVVVMGSFGFIARTTIAITAPIERLCDNNK
jgi:hypothetical protein